MGTSGNSNNGNKPSFNSCYTANSSWYDAIEKESESVDSCMHDGEDDDVYNLFVQNNHFEDEYCDSLDVYQECRELAAKLEDGIEESETK